MGRKGSGKAESTPRRAHTPFRHPSPGIVRAGPRPQPSRAARRPHPPSLRQAAPAKAATQSPGSQPHGARARGEGASATDLRGCCGRAASAGDTDRWAHGGVALGRPPLLRLRWWQYLLSPPTSLPPTPPPPSPPPPPPNHRSTEGETQRLTTTWLPPPPPLPSPPLPPGHRARARHSGKQGREHSPRCRSSQWLPTLLPRSGRRPAGVLRVRTLSALARFGLPSRVCSPALTFRASCGFWGRLGRQAGVRAGLGSALRGLEVQAWCFRSRLTSLSSRVGPSLQNSLTLGFLPRSSLFSPSCLCGYQRPRPRCTPRTSLSWCWHPQEPDSNPGL